MEYLKVSNEMIHQVLVKVVSAPAQTIHRYAQARTCFTL